MEKMFVENIKLIENQRNHFQEQKKGKSLQNTT